MYRSGIVEYSRSPDHPIIDGLLRRSMVYPEPEIKRSFVFREPEREDIKRSSYVVREPNTNFERREVIKRNVNEQPQIRISPPTEKVISTKEDIEYVSVQVPVHKQSQIIERIVEVPVEVIKEKVSFLNCLLFNLIIFLIFFLKYSYIFFLFLKFSVTKLLIEFNYFFIFEHILFFSIYLVISPYFLVFLYL